jgi:hypothetical protein
MTLEAAMRRTAGVAATAVILLCLGATAAAPAPLGVGVGHRLQIRYPTVRAGRDEPFREEARNPGPSPIQVTVFGVITFPCGGWRDIDPLAQVVEPNGGTADWNVLFQTLADCPGTYTVTETIEDQFGQAQDTSTFTARP